MNEDVRAQLVDERTRTVNQIEALARTFEDLVESTNDVATDDEHDPEGHTIAFERQQVAALVRDARSHLVDIDCAVGRVDAGTYGICERCGRPIPPERLAALTATSTCVDCAGQAT